jgi:hypothetical protein
MYDKLQLGWANSLLAFLAILLGWPTPFILWKYGAVLRAKFPYIVIQVVQKLRETLGNQTHRIWG